MQRNQHRASTLSGVLVFGALLAALLAIDASRVSLAAEVAESGSATAATAVPPSAELREGLVRRLATQPLVFIENRGQWPSAARFVSRGAGVVARLEADGIALVLMEGRDPSRPFGGARRGTVVRLAFEGASDGVEVEGGDRSGSAYHFFRGRHPAQWRNDVPAYREVVYRGLYECVDLRVYDPRTRGTAGGSLEYDLVLAPGADLDQVVLRCEGTQGLSLDPGGALLIGTALGPLRQPAPITWQALSDGSRRPVECRYRILGPDSFGFEAAAVDPGLSLVIDPVVEWGWLLGGPGFDGAEDVQLGPEGTLVVAGFAQEDFPIEIPPQGVFGEDHGGGWDVIVMRVDAISGEVLSSTYLGGEGNDIGAAAAVDAAGNIGIAGTTESDEFPATNRSSYGGSRDGFAATLSPSGDALLFATYLGGAGEDGASCAAVTDEGDLVVAGWTASRDFPTTEGALQETHAGGLYDSFVVRLTPANAGTLADQLAYGTYLGGTAEEAWRGTGLLENDALYERLMNQAILVDGDRCAVITAGTSSDDFPTTAGAYQRVLSGQTDQTDVYVVKLRLDARLPAAEQLAYATFLGGPRFERGMTLALDPSGDVWVGGSTYSSTYPTTAGAYRRTQANPSGDFNDGFLTRLRLDGTIPPAEQLRYSTLLGGSQWDAVRGLAVSPDGVLFATGRAASDDFPTTAGALHEVRNGGTGDAYLIVLDPDPLLPSSAQYLYATFFGGGSWDDPASLVMGPDGEVVIAGNTDSFEFPSLPGSESAGAKDAFLVRIDVRPPRAAFAVSSSVVSVGESIRFDPGGSATPAGGTIASYQWDFGDGRVENLTTGAEIEHAYAAPARYVARLTVSSEAAVRRTAVRSVTVICQASDIEPWTATDIGSPPYPGSARFEGTSEPGDAPGLRACAGGHLLAGVRDQLFFAYQEVRGDFLLTMRLDEVSGSPAGWQAGVMLRESLEPGSRHLAMVLEKAGALAAIRFAAVGRSVRSGFATRVPGDAGTPGAAWLRLARVADVVTGSYSPDGESWTELDTLHLDGAPEVLFAGLAAAGDDSGAPAAYEALRSVFRQISLLAGDDGIGPFLRGDSTGDGKLDISDPIQILAYLFAGGAAPGCVSAANVNGDGKVDLSDPAYALNHLFLGAPPPPAPFPSCEISTVEIDRALGCGEAAGCGPQEPN